MAQTFHEDTSRLQEVADGARERLLARVDELERRGRALLNPAVWLDTSREWLRRHPFVLVMASAVIALWVAARATLSRRAERRDLLRRLEHIVK